jgi:hypothetical protein
MQLRMASKRIKSGAEGRSGAADAVVLETEGRERRRIEEVAPVEKDGGPH